MADKLNKYFNSLIAERNFNKQLSQAKPIIGLVIRIGLFLITRIGKNLSNIPILKVLYRPTMSLISMHNLAAKNGLDLLVSNKKEDYKNKENCSLENTKDRVRDLIIIGSGPGGAVTARNASLGSLDFLTIEKGNLLDKSIPSHSVEQMSRHFRQGGQELILSWPMVTFAQGETWGGGSSINSGLFHEIPARVRDTWGKSVELTEEDFLLAKSKVVFNLKVEKQIPELLGIYKNSPIMSMKKNLNWEGGVVPRWRKYVTSEEYVHFGMNETYLDQLKAENRLLGHEVTSIKIEGNLVELKIKGSSCTHLLKARSVCIAAGTIATPELLVRSNLAKPKDFYFQFHAMVKELGKFPNKVNDLKDIDPHQIWTEDLNFKIGAAVGTPDLLTAILETKGIEGEQDFSKICSLYVSIPSFGRNGLIRQGNGLTPYFFPNSSMRKALKGAQKILRKGIESAGGQVLGDDSLSVSTVHVFGSIPLGKSTLVDKRGFLKGSDRKIFIRDASLLPSHPLVNPQGPLMQLLTALDDSRKIFG